ncbi:TPA: MBL fold metallo-hydrolase [archaeon]|uniref:MBL fold metallo-hydrolase n=1 Tax=Candidatus Naiadarchaeum limnaeum TaxID=2756139 RepID=A0A832XLS8_9ARCH|nr:MBL fold metallo-hydrolase [Candidatus Naiadarchaeales archaeon SRR2090153.bin1042]HIK00278.1 MBL fold metallo-hydrolase [Candidatus Naiadarchaeum limnaeum]
MFFGRNSPIESNSYLILGDKIILVDTGMRAETLIENIESVGIKMSDIDFIVNTHCHFDHIRSNKILKDAARAKIAAHKEDEPYISKADPDYTVSKYLANNLKAAKVDLALKEGDKLGDFEVIHTPGHTKGSICLLNRAQGILITGDTIFAQGFTGRTDLPGGSQEQLKTSLKKLEKFDLEKILPGHEQPVLKNANQNIENALLILESAYL